MDFDFSVFDAEDDGFFEEDADRHAAEDYHNLDGDVDESTFDDHEDYEDYEQSTALYRPGL